MNLRVSSFVCTFLIAVFLLPCAWTFAQHSIPSSPYDAVKWLEKNHCTISTDANGTVKSVVMGYLPRVFVIGDLDVFPELESIELTYSSRWEDKHMSGIARLGNLKKVAIRNCDRITESSLAVLHYLPELEEIELDSCDSIYSLAPLRACGNLKRIKLTNNSNFNFYGLKKIVSLPKLEILELNENPSLEDAHLNLLSEAVNLKTLTLIGCTSITDKGLQVLSHLPELKKLNLYRCSEVNGTGLQHASEGLEFLVMRGTTFNAEGLQHLARFKSLKELYFGKHESFDDESLNVIASSESLEKLALDGVAVKESHFKLMSGCQNLKVLYLTECDHVTGTALEFLAGSTGLETLELIRCRRIDSPDMNAVGAFTNLKHLDLSGTRIRAEGVAMLTGLQSLESLNLSNCKWVDDSCLTSVCQLASLKKLKLNEVKRVTDDGLKALGVLPALETLSISDNHQVTGSGFGGFSNDSPLRTLEMFRLDKLSPDGLHSLVGLGNLERLKIECKNLQNAHLLAMQGMPRLKNFDIEDMEKVDSEVYRRFCRSLPGYDY